MGGVVSGLFGGSSSGSSSGNQAFGYLKKSLDPVISKGVGSNNAIADLLGVGGDPAKQQGAFQNFLNSSGYQFQLGQGQRAITSSNAARGLLNSGSALKGLSKFGQNLGSSYFQNYLGQLGSVADRGVSAAGTVSGAGQTSSSESSSNDGLLSGVGGLIGGIGGFFSDERLKKNMRHFATDKNGIRYFDWEWNEKAKKELGLEGKAAGVSAHELRGTKWEKALGERDGYMTVKYWMLPDALTEEEKEAA